MLRTLARPSDHRPAPAPAYGAGAGPVVARASGAWLELADGTRLLDLTSGAATVNVGHGHPRVLDAAREQMERLVHAGGVLGHATLPALAGRLRELAPDGIGHFAFCVSGSEAVETALRVARDATGRPGVVCFRGGFHGRTLGALDCSTAVSRAPGRPPPGDVAVAPFPRPGAWGLDPEAAAARALAGLDALHRRGLAGGRTACYLVEPVQGLGGCHPAGRAFLAGLRERADRHGALLVMDEVQTGIGRSGAPVAASLYGVAPDLICLGKALGAGFPIAAVGGGGRLRRALAACAHGSTFSGSPLSCAAAIAGLDVLRDEELCRRARLLGARASWRLRASASGIATVAEVRGPGLMIGVELADPDTRRPRPDLAAAVCERARARGVLVMLSGRHANVIRILPPLVIDEDDLDDGLAVVEEALALMAGG